MKLHLLVVSSLLLISCNKSFGQNSTQTAYSIRPEIMRLVRKIAADNMLKSAGVGETGVRTPQWERYEALKKGSTNEELRALTDNNNSVVRCYALQALATRKIDVFPIVLQHLADTAQVKTFMGCIKSSIKAGDFFIDVVTPDYVDPSCYKLNSSQQTALDSILLSDATVRVDRKALLLAEIKPDPKFYKQIRQQAQQGSPQATLALARFQKESDVNIIEKLFSGGKVNSYYAIYSAREYPSPKFYPFLVKSFENEWHKERYDYSKWRLLYQALAKYPTNETYKLLERTVHITDDFRRQTLGTYLMIALKKYPNPKFASLMPLIKLDRYHLDDVYNQSDIEK
jgi:hypothetical protein